MDDENAAVVCMEGELLAAAGEGNDGGVLEEVSRGREGGGGGSWGRRVRRFADISAQERGAADGGSGQVREKA